MLFYPRKPKLVFMTRCPLHLHASFILKSPGTLKAVIALIAPAAMVRASPEPASADSRIQVLPRKLPPGENIIFNAIVRPSFSRRAHRVLKLNPQLCMDKQLIRRKVKVPLPQGKATCVRCATLF